MQQSSSKRQLIFCQIWVNQYMHTLDSEAQAKADNEATASMILIKSICHNIQTKIYLTKPSKFLMFRVKLSFLGCLEQHVNLLTLNIVGSLNLIIYLKVIEKNRYNNYHQMHCINTCTIFFRRTGIIDIICIFADTFRKRTDSYLSGYGLFIG